MLVVGILSALGSALSNDWMVAAIVGWAAACLTYIVWTWLTIHAMDAATTAAHATREDPARAVTDILVLIASIASLGAIAVLLLLTHSESTMGRSQTAFLAFASIVLSWVLVHTLFTVRYAFLFYTGRDGGIDFNQTEAPRYTDFAYLAFTLGMTFQVSDTSITDHAIRMVALRHSVLSYLFGSIILASVVNLIGGLYK